MIDYTLVVGVDKYHLSQLVLTWPTWQHNKPSMFRHTPIVFHDDSVTPEEFFDTIRGQARLVKWPPYEVEYERTGEDRFGDPQRYKMLAGFIYVAASQVATPYWLKVDTDSVASGMDDWVDDSWFAEEPAIVSQPWGFTRPAELLQQLDDWVERRKVPFLRNYPPLGLKLSPESDCIRHRRIISWCGFFERRFTRLCRDLAWRFAGRCKLPVPSQDTYQWYVAARTGLKIVTAQMKSRGWEHWHTFHNVKTRSEAVMHG